MPTASPLSPSTVGPGTNGMGIIQEAVHSVDDAIAMELKLVTIESTLFGQSSELLGAAHLTPFQRPTLSWWSSFCLFLCTFPLHTLTWPSTYSEACRQNGVRSLSKRMMLLACLIMYAVSATHWAVSLRSLIFQQNTAKYLLGLTSSCLTAISNKTTCTTEVESANHYPVLHISPSLDTALLSVNVSRHLRIRSTIPFVTLFSNEDRFGRFHCSMESLDFVGTESDFASSISPFANIYCR